MPGKGGMRPDQSSRSVPVLMPLNAMSTSTSASARGARVSGATARRSGASSTTATVSTVALSLFWLQAFVCVTLHRRFYPSTIIYTFVCAVMRQTSSGRRVRRSRTLWKPAARSMAVISPAVRGRPLPIASK